MKKIILIFCIISFSCAQLLGMQQAVNIAAESAEQRGHKRHAQGQEVADAGAASPVQKARSESPKPQEVVIASPEKLDIPINIGAIKVLPRDITTQLKAIYQSTEISLKKSFGLDDSNPLEYELYPLLPLDPHHQKKREAREKKVQEIRSKLFYHQGLIFVLQNILVEFQLKYFAEDQKKSTRRTITTCLLGPDEEKIIMAATPPNYDRVSDLLEILKEDPFLKRLLPEKCTEIWQQEQASIPAFIKVLVKNHTSKTAIYKHPEKLFSDYILPQITRKHLEEISSTEDN
ncbi:MAG TPA: hypothetical protein VJ201_08160, partial [Candidatus Babeliales bacterium]|nr:hypothetical protein [Candidatus Babeliales bacterium]